MYDIEKIFDVVLAFNSMNDRTELLSIILSQMMEITNSDAGTLYTVEEGKLHFRIIQNKSMGIFQTKGINLPPIVLDKYQIQNVSAYSAIKNEIIVIDDVYDEIYDNYNGYNLYGPKNYDKMTGYRTRAMLVLPICAQSGADGDVLGVIQMMNPINQETGEPGIYGNIYDPPIVPALAKVAANTLSNLTYTKELRMLFRSFASVMMQVIDERSPYNVNHTRNVALYCEKFAIYLSSIFPHGHIYHFSESHIERIVLAALLHDVGKIVIPLSIMDKATRLGSKLEVIQYRFQLKRAQLKIDLLDKRIDDAYYESEIKIVNEAEALVEEVNASDFLRDDQIERIGALNRMTFVNNSGLIINLLDSKDFDALSVRKGTLTHEERKVMQDHVSITGRLLDKIPFWKYYTNVPDWARFHHEFLDGSGYPDRLTGEDIPIEACIITIMDIFDALISRDRPYKEEVAIDMSLKILMGMAEEGKLHKELVRLFEESKIWEDIYED